MNGCMDYWNMRTLHIPTVNHSASHPHPSRPPTHLYTIPSHTEIVKWVMAATIPTMHDDDDNENDELLSIFLPPKCQSAKVD